MMITQEQILKELEALDKEGFDVHILGEAWFSARAINRAAGIPSQHIPAVSVVRVGLPKMGCVELHPTEDGKVHLLCYCCFVGDEEKGIFPLDKLRSAVLELSEHSCPPWPG